MKILNLSLLSALCILLASCGSTKNIPYLVDAEQLSEKQLKETAMIYEAKIMPKDILTVTVNTTVPEAAVPFNLPLAPANAGSINTTQLTYGAGLQNYIVDNAGNIEFPVLGTLHVAGLTRVQVQNLIKSKIYPQFLKEEPVINVRFQNYKISVLGEVARPGSFTATNEQCTLFDALAMAGDLTIYGKRENVMLIREYADGSKAVYRINLQDKDLVLNPQIYYLQQNDVLIIEPNKTKARAAGIGSSETFTISIVSTLISVATLIITATR
jgi:polysaccharide export outer membrane protein